MKIEYTYKAKDYHDDIDEVYFNINQLEEKLKKNKLKKDDRELLLTALEIIQKLRESSI